MQKMGRRLMCKWMQCESVELEGKHEVWKFGLHGVGFRSLESTGSQWTGQYKRDIFDFRESYASRACTNNMCECLHW